MNETVFGAPLSCWVHPARYGSGPLKLFRGAAGSGLKPVADCVHPSLDVLFPCRGRRIPAHRFVAMNFAAVAQCTGLVVEPAAPAIGAIFRHKQHRAAAKRCACRNRCGMKGEGAFACRHLRQLGVNKVDAERSAEHECDRNRCDHAAPFFPVPRFSAAGGDVRNTRGSNARYRAVCLDVRAQGTTGSHGCDQCYARIGIA